MRLSFYFIVTNPALHPFQKMPARFHDSGKQDPEEQQLLDFFLTFIRLFL